MVGDEPVRLDESRCHALTMSLCVHFQPVGCVSKHRLWRQIGVLVNELPHYFCSQQPLWFGQELHSLQPCTPGEMASRRDSWSYLYKQTDACAGEVDADGITRCEVTLLGFLATLITLFRGSCGHSDLGERQAALLRDPFIILASCTQWVRGEVNAQSAFLETEMENKAVASCY